MNKPRHMYYRSIADMNEVIIRNLARIPEEVDLVVGIPRSGLLAANMIALYLNRPMTDLAGLGEGRLLAKGKRHLPNGVSESAELARRILVVDDCVSKGAEMQRARGIVQNAGFIEKTIFLSVFSFPEHPRVADIVMEIIPRPMLFQWSFMHTPELKTVCLDMDGLILRKGSNEDNDDGRDCVRSLQEARPLFLPTHEVGWLVTSRHEKYRSETMDWLARHGVTYRELIMLNESPEPAKPDDDVNLQFKVDAYLQTNADVFVESSPILAKQIAKRAGRPTLCMATNRVIGSPAIEAREINLQRRKHFTKRARHTLKRLVTLQWKSRN